MSIGARDIAFFGLGALGAPLAARLHAAGHRLAVSDPDVRVLTAHRAACGADAIVPDAAQVCITCVTDEAAAEALMFGEGGLAQRLGAGALVIDHTTTSPAFSRRAAAAFAARGAGFVDAPLSGGVAGARAGKLLGMLGGDPADCLAAEAVLAAYCARVVRFGAAGAGQAAKLANQLCIAGTVRGLHEAAGFARACGLDPAMLFGALAAGSAHSAQMDQHAGALAAAAAPFGERFGWIAKDLALAAEEMAARGGHSALADWLLTDMTREAA